MTAQAPISIADVEALAKRALMRAGAGEQAATSLAKAIAAAERDGIVSHGLAYLGTYCEHLECGKVVKDAMPKLERPAPSMIVVDAACGFAHPAIDRGFAELVPTTRQQGLAGLAIRNSYNCGALGYHTERLAQQGLVGIGFTNAPASIAPSGGRKPAFGTNPWSIAVPDGTGGAAIVIDQSASVVAKSEVMKKAREGQPIPLGWALDKDGRPTTDAKAGLEGSMIPSGGYKGACIALFVEVMAACLPGATLGIHASPFSGPVGGPPRTGQFFIAIDPGASSGGLFAERLSALMAELTSDPNVHVPGAGRRAKRAVADTRGVTVAADVLQRARKLADG
jgi:(2R)-3-sulfolactate dehydrogenase (NADP+)